MLTKKALQMICKPSGTAVLDGMTSRYPRR
jgi:hypothetical protein